MRIARANTIALLVSLSLSGCSGGTGGLTRARPDAAADANAYPSSYRQQIVALLTTTLEDRRDYRGVLIAEPALKPVGGSQHYVVCLRFNARSQLKDRVVVYLGNVPMQFVEAKPEQCAGAAYQPFTELEGAIPDSSSESNPFDFSYKQ